MRTFRSIALWAAVTLSLISCGVSPTEAPEEGGTATAAVRLPDFTYTGTAPAYILLHTRSEDYYRSFTYREAPRGNLYTEGAVISAAGTSDIVFSDITFSDGDDTNANQNATLRIASDEDGSGDLNDGDIYMPEYVFKLADGADIALPDINFDTGSTLVADVVGGINHQSRTFDLTISVPPGDGMVYLFIEDSPDLSAGTYEREIPVPSTEITEIRVTTLPDDVARDFYVLLFQDLNGNGEPDTGEPASADVPVTSIPFSFHIEPGEGGAGPIVYTLTGQYTVQP
jgi:uncharacterized protein (DUF2141 family)